jgi:hypothetical protein
VLNDFAQQSKKGFNAIMQKLGGDKDRERDREEGGFVVVGREGEGDIQRRGTTNKHGHGLAAGRTGETGPMKSVKLKREADEAGEHFPPKTWTRLMRNQTRRIGLACSTWSPFG